MMVQTEKRGDIHIVRPAGRLDSATSGAFEQAVAAVFDDGGCRVVIDFSQLAYISSAGLRGTLIAGKKARAIDGGRLVLCALSPSVREIFEVSGFTSIFTLCDDLDAALAELA